ncbi:cyclase family protein [Brevibacterium jeotgali]|uniref:Kynurenine formamidase n=1 Tax=Brevibacterium jeotgali TaxID=1262550 RepID=A0A2H1L3W7_9MICO|nr:cyclase family protein [Brevibacterium jeotgali]TWC01851.1 kynurenine formamidase [Brevibacterium jeotgali]SMY11598.1 Kynurenine formamidase [Brevibacterium jeotgali]
MSDVPNLSDLLADAPKNWGRWGDDDEVGALNFLTNDQVLRGVRSIRDGNIHTLQRLIGDPKGDPVWPSRLPAEREMVIDESAWDSDDGPKVPGGLHYADDKLVAFLQGSTQYDALGHVWYGGQIWNGYDARTTIGGLDKASVEPIAQRGVVGRGVLIDMARHFGVEAVEARRTFNHTDLLAAAESQGVTLEKHDILLIRTNHLQLFFEQSDTFYEDFCEPGLQYSPELVQWFHEVEIPNLVTDTIANEVTTDPDTGVALTLHNALMRNLGIALTELCDLEDLAAACAEDGRWDFLYVAAPLKIHRATGSPVNPVVIR